MWKYFMQTKHETVVFGICICIGPDKWGDEYPVANGPRQSPINIVPMEAQYDSSLKALKLKYDPSNSSGILNNGHSFQVDFVDDTDSSSKHSSFHLYGEIEKQRHQTLHQTAIFVMII